MCAGVTLYDPLKRYGATTGTKVAIVGMGGLGSIGVQIAHAMGCDVTAITRNANKDEHCKKLGATTIIHSTDAMQMKASEGNYLYFVCSYVTSIQRIIVVITHRFTLTSFIFLICRRVRSGAQHHTYRS